MSSTQFIRGRDETASDRGPIPFPSERTGRSASNHGRPSARPALSDSVEDVLLAFDTVSRRITDLARELNCLGYFDDPNGDRPRAA